jgi:kojibiose phosphorylase
MQAILGIDGVNKTQVLKQPDVLMLLYLFPELFAEPVLRRNYDYYKPRTDYAFGSSVGPAIQSILSCRVQAIEEAYEVFTLSAFADLYDVRGNAGDGIHAASAGGLWQALVFGFAGVKLDKEGFTLEPRLPSHWTYLEFPFMVRGKKYRVKITRLELGFDSQIIENP